jgi:hypothetical protein
MKTYPGPVNCIISIFIIALALIFVVVLFRHKTKRDEECPFCLRQKENYAPCGCGYCEDCCRSCLNIKVNCRYINDYL